MGQGNSRGGRLDVAEAYAGDIIGLHNHGTINIGGGDRGGAAHLHRRAELRAGNIPPRGAEAAATQLFKFEVVAFRLAACSAGSSPSTSPWRAGCAPADEKRLAEFRDKAYDNLAVDHAGELVYLAPTRVNLTQRALAGNRIHEDPRKSRGLIAQSDSVTQAAGQYGQW